MLDRRDKLSKERSHVLQRMQGLFSILLVGLLVGMPGLGAAGHDQHHIAAAGQHGGDAHAHHRKAVAVEDGYTQSVRSYAVPDITVTTQDGHATSLVDLLDEDGPILLNFIFTSCTTICPVMTATFSQVHHLLGEDADGVRMISISIDPEYDTPARLSKYASRHGAGESWSFLTGKQSEIVQIQRAFDAYRGSKMNHIPIMLMRRSQSEPWLRIEGFPTASQVVKHYRELGFQ